MDTLEAVVKNFNDETICIGRLLWNIFIGI